MFIEEQIQNLQRRIKSIEQNPRPEYMKSNKLMYEIQLENFMYIMESWKAGKPFAVMEFVGQLASCMGFVPQGYIMWGDRVRDPQRYYNLAVSKMGFPEHTCDRTMTALGLFLSGEVPTPKFMVTQRIPCDPERWSSTAAAKYAGVLHFELSRLGSCDDENTRCLAEQVEELIEFAEKSVPGIKYDESKLIELQEKSRLPRMYLRESYELRKKVPCPISPQDAFRLAAMGVNPRHPEKSLEYCRMYRDELFERAEKGIGGVPDEKLRIAWLATGPYGRSTFDLLSKKGVALPWFHYGMGPHAFGLLANDDEDLGDDGRQLKPIEKLVKGWNSNVWGGQGEMWVDSLITACRDLKIDAVVDFLQVGCITTKNLKRITAQRVKEELGIPTLDLEGREFFATEAGTIEMNKKLEDFLDLCIANKK